MSLPPVAHPRNKSPFVFSGNVFSAGNRSEEDLQEKRIKEVVLPILAVLGGFFLFPFDAAILFTAIVIFGVFICGNGPVSGPLPPERLPLSQRPNVGDPNYNPWGHISPVKPSDRKTPQFLATPVQGTPTFRPTPGTIRGVAHWLGVSEGYMDPIAQSIVVSPQTFARGLSIRDPSLESKQSKNPKFETPPGETLNVRRQLSGDFSSGLTTVPEGFSD